VNALPRLEKQGQVFWLLVGGSLIGLIGIADYLTGPELAFSIFYVVPISLVTWFTTRRLGLVTSIVSAIVWLVVDITAGAAYPRSFVDYWNTAMQLASFFVVTALLSAVRATLQREQELARIDYLTRAGNTRYLVEMAEMELARSRRYKRPFTLAYIDLDNFKTVNDHFGHSVGDQVLCLVTSSIRQHFRKTDVVARLGGDEFVVVFPETGQDAAQVVIPKIQLSLSKAMQENSWPVTFSIGVVTCNGVPATAEEVIRMADGLMYSVKRNHKDAIRYAIYGG
jgi:diguanylate cyclase (GGDEF)-like protein